MEINYPKKERNEAEVQALLWYFLRKERIDARLQVIVGSKARLDIVCFKNKQAVCIIECKSWSRSYSLVRRYRLNNTRQLKKYQQLFNLPVFVCGRANDITRVKAEILSLFRKTGTD